MVCLIILAVLSGLSVATENIPGRNLIVVSIPDIENDYYEPFYNEILDFLIEYENTVENENFIILADKQGIKNLRDRVDEGRFLYGPMLDIWMRDMTSTGRKPGGQAMFGYQPNSTDKKLAKEIRDSFLKTMAFYGIDEPFDGATETIVDGGNIVDNGIDWAIATDRIYKDNNVENDPAGQERIRSEITKLLNIENELVVVKEIPGDTLGHSDGYVAFLGDNAVAISSMGLNEKEIDDQCWGDKGCEQVKAAFKEIQDAFKDTNVKTFIVPSKYKPEKWRDFNSGCGAHVNTLVTDEYAYVPMFYDPASEDTFHDQEADDTAYDLFEEHIGDRTIVPITVPNVICRMGGNVRCLGWQVSGPIADKLVAAANAAVDSYYDDAELDRIEEEYYGEEEY